MHKFLLDAQLPRSFKSVFAEFGLECIHTLDLPEQNRTIDSELLRLNEEDGSVIVTKDNDFVESYLVTNKPKKLLLISCGNMRNPQLLALFHSNIERIAREFEFNNYIEIDTEEIIIHS